MSFEENGKEREKRSCAVKLKHYRDSEFVGHVLVRTHQRLIRALVPWPPYYTAKVGDAGKREMVAKREPIETEAENPLPLLRIPPSNTKMPTLFLSPVSLSKNPTFFLFYYYYYLAGAPHLLIPLVLMEAVMLNSKQLLRFYTHDPLFATGFTWKKRNTVCCFSSGNAPATSNRGVASVLKERGTLYHNRAPTEAGSLVFSPNGNDNPEELIGVRDSKPYNVGTATTLMEDSNEGGIGILPFLKGKRILITGATGFLGKVLIEKILRTAPDVGEIFVLIKAQSRNAAMNRVKKEIINTELFKCLQELHGKSYQSFMLSKLVPVVGNIRETNLGILEPDMVEEIAGKVDIIVNSAANTTFDERYDTALDINTKGPWRLMNFAKRCRKLKLFLHVSTAYVNGQRQGRVMEKAFSMGDTIARERATLKNSFSPMSSLPLLDVESEIKLALALQTSSEEGNEVAQRMKAVGLQRSRLHGWQDTYVFTKAMGEMLINSSRGEVPVVIMRPSVIESTYKDPFPGWIEGNRMMDPIVLYYGKGQLTGFLVDPKGILDVVPADMVVNATLAAMAKHGGGGGGGRPGINIYHIASSVKNPLLFQDLARHLFEHFNCYPYMDSKGRPIRVPEMKLFHSMDDFASHIWTDARAAMAASPEKISRRFENILGKWIEQAKYLANIYEPYTFYGGKFDNTNTEKLMEAMCEEEKRRFDFNVGRIEWEDYISKVHIPGLRRHVMKGRGSTSAIFKKDSPVHSGHSLSKSHHLEL
ncbi:hypothetical protein H6P81_009587 [Aristolochia fimbriata]|uniref:Fatty acyl-CoA reductase n=1 Tax=Aristolochia fimbriata TaxID=158543 RepID=A0AAV7EPS6_ARIFI|nr:hypothetical protein H6P81_009587 [Aristolochia fimbriata]